MKKLFVPLVLISFGECFGQPPGDNPLRTKTDSLVQEAVDSFFRSSGHVGLSLAVYYKGSIDFYNYGTKEKALALLPGKRTLYEIGSLTKTFTGVLLAKGTLDKKINLDGDIRNYLTQQYPNLEFRGQPITSRQLITHRSGLPDNIPDNAALFKHPNFDSLPFQLLSREKGYDRRRYLEELHDIKLDTMPGAVFFKYSNIGIKLLSFMLENIYHATYEDLLIKHILKPLRMKNTAINITQKAYSRLAKGYNLNGNLMPYALPNAGAAGGLKSTTEDMIRYVVWHLDESNPLVSQSHSLLDGDLKTYARGMAWNMAYTNEGDRKVWQSGGTFGMSSQLILFPDHKIGFILLANDAGFNTQGELEKIALHVFNAVKTL